MTEGEGWLRRGTDPTRPFVHSTLSTLTSRPSRLLSHGRGQCSTGHVTIVFIDALRAVIKTRSILARLTDYNPINCDLRHDGGFGSPRVAADGQETYIRA